MSKKELVNDIKTLLLQVGIEKNWCTNITSINNIAWVSHTQVCKRKRVADNLFRTYREKLYSKEVSLGELLLIKEELQNRIN